MHICDIHDTGCIVGHAASQLAVTVNSGAADRNLYSLERGTRNLAHIVGHIGCRFMRFKG